MKPGIKTTEFWLSLVSHIVGGAFAFNLVPTSGPFAQIAGLAVLVLSGLGYTVSRTLTKTAAATAVVADVASTVTEITDADRAALATLAAKFDKKKV